MPPFSISVLITLAELIWRVPRGVSFYSRNVSRGAWVGMGQSWDHIYNKTVANKFNG